MAEFWRDLSRREMLKSSTMAAMGAAITPELLYVAAEAQGAAAATVELWGIFEAFFPGPATGNPFVEVEFAATFEQSSKTNSVTGFYDGDGIYRVRFMPDSTGLWTYRTKSNRPELDGKTGSFTVRAAAAGNRGSVRVKDQYHFIYADGTPYRELGTTCYAWTSQPNALEEQTLKTLANAPFNKLRMCVFPKWFNYNHVEPTQYPFVGQARITGTSPSSTPRTFSIWSGGSRNWELWASRPI